MTKPSKFFGICVDGLHGQTKGGNQLIGLADIAPSCSSCSEGGGLACHGELRGFRAAFRVFPEPSAFSLPFLMTNVGEYYSNSDSTSRTSSTLGSIGAEGSAGVVADILA